MNYEWYKAKLKRFNSEDRYQAELKVLKDELEHLPSVNTVLDYGCGTGYAMRYLSKYFDVYGYDRFCYYEGDLSKFNQSGIVYDAVYFMHSINHIPNISTRMEWFRKLLRDDGYIIIITPNISHLPEGHKADPTVIEYLEPIAIHGAFSLGGFIFTKADYTETYAILIFQKK